MGGIIWFHTTHLDKIRKFYTQAICCDVWLDQKEGRCLILRHGNLLLGFCEKSKPETQGLLCFVYDDRASVDNMYLRFKDLAEDRPKANPMYRIYHFFAVDPEGRRLEFQSFDDPVDKIW